MKSDNTVYENCYGNKSLHTKIKQCSKEMHVVGIRFALL